MTTMRKGVSIWLECQLEDQPILSFVEWAGEVDVGKAISTIDNMKAGDYIGKGKLKGLSKVLFLSVVMREMSTGDVLHMKRLL